MKKTLQKRMKRPAPKKPAPPVSGLHVVTAAAAPTKAQVMTAREEAIRHEVKELLIAATKGSMLTPEVISFFLSMPYMRVYRLTKADSIWLPRMTELEPIMDFLKLVEAMRQGAELLLEQRDKLLTMPTDAGRAFFHPAIWKTLKTGSTSTDEKRQFLTLRGLQVLKLQLERKTKEASK